MWISQSYAKHHPLLFIFLLINLRTLFASYEIKQTSSTTPQNIPKRTSTTRDAKTSGVSHEKDRGSVVTSATSTDIVTGIKPKVPNKISLTQRSNEHNKPKVPSHVAHVQSRKPEVWTGHYEGVRHNSSYDCIFGFSTGHVGTTTLSRSDHFGKPGNAAFLFEGKIELSGGNYYKNPSLIVLKTAYENNFTVQNEISFVRNVFESKILHLAAQAHLQTYRHTIGTELSLFVDLGHFNLYYYRGIQEYFHEKRVQRQQQQQQKEGEGAQKDKEFCSNILWVRIRRIRYDNAKSLMFNSVGAAEKTDLYKTMVVAFHPFKNIPAVQLHPPSEEVWNTFNGFQQALWMVDEVEARWQAFKKQYQGKLHYIEPTEWSHDLQPVLDAVAAVLRVQPKLLNASRTGHLQIHAGRRQIALLNTTNTTSTRTNSSNIETDTIKNGTSSSSFSSPIVSSMTAHEVLEEYDVAYKRAMLYQCTKPGSVLCCC